MLDITFLTSAIDIGRAQLSHDFGRPFSFYREKLAALCDIDIRLVVYGSRDLGLAEGSRLAVVPTDLRSLETMSCFEKIQEIRASERWLSQADWLRRSPQACLAHYNPLVMSKLFWLAQEARLNRFGTRHFAWIDAGISHTVPIDCLKQALTSAELTRSLRKFRLICFPYQASGEVHGFERGAMERYCGSRPVEWVARGGFFGGSADYVLEAHRLYASLLDYTLHRHHMGTEESVLTILGHLHPEIFQTYLVEKDGLIWPFFADLIAGRAEH